MTDPTNELDQDVTPTLEEVARRRADLREAILGLELAAARPAVGREEKWREGIVEPLDELEREILEHIDVTERDDGLYTQIIEDAPRLGHRIELLRAEHPEMLAAASGLKSRLQASDPPTADEARDEIHSLLGQLVRHRQRGADLVWEAYSVDTGGTE